MAGKRVPAEVRDSWRYVELVVQFAGQIQTAKGSWYPKDCIEHAKAQIDKLLTDD